MDENNSSLRLFDLLNYPIDEQTAKDLDNKEFVYKVREVVTAQDCVDLINYCFDKSLSDKKKALYVTLTRKYCAQEPVKSLLKKLWFECSDELKEAIMWRLLDDGDLEQKWQFNIFNYVKDNFHSYFYESIISYYGDGTAGLMKNIDSYWDKSFPQSKKWIYLISLLFYKNTDNDRFNEVVVDFKSKVNNKLTQEVYNFFKLKINE